LARASNCAPNTPNDARESFFSSPPRDLHDSLRTWIGRLGGASSRVARPLSFFVARIPKWSIDTKHRVGEMIDVNIVMRFVDRSRAETAIAEAITSRGVGARASRVLIGTPASLWTHLAIRLDQARLVTCHGVAKRLASTQKVVATAIATGPADPAALQDWIVAVMVGLQIRYGNRLEAAVLHRDGPLPVIVAVIVPADPALRARRELDPGFREPAKRTSKAVPSNTVDVREATAPRKPGNAEAIVIILPRGPAPLPVDYDASFEAVEPTRNTMIELMPTSPRLVRPGSERVPARPGIELASAARDPSLTWMALQDDRASNLGGRPRCQKVVSADVGSAVATAPIAGVIVPHAHCDQGCTPDDVDGAPAPSTGDAAEDPGFGFMRRAAWGQESHFTKQLRTLRPGEAFQVPVRPVAELDATAPILGCPPVTVRGAATEDIRHRDVLHRAAYHPGGADDERVPMPGSCRATSGTGADTSLRVPDIGHAGAHWDHGLYSGEAPGARHHVAGRDGRNRLENAVEFRRSAGADPSDADVDGIRARRPGYGYDAGGTRHAVLDWHSKRTLAAEFGVQVTRLSEVKDAVISDQHVGMVIQTRFIRDRKPVIFSRQKPCNSKAKRRVHIVCQ